MFSRLFGGRPRLETQPEAPPGTRIYAIGDIHGRSDLLHNLHRVIEKDAAGGHHRRTLVVYLGDYVDRGSSSRQVIDLLVNDPLPRFEKIHLTGNHEEMMLTFLDDASIGPMWIVNGGDATLLSYGIAPIEDETPDDRYKVMQRALSEMLPRTHVDFLRSLGLYHEEGDYLFVHAGVLPGRRIEDQLAEDLLWIREEFIGSDADHGKCVVHGHTIVAAPEIRANRIGLDTGAYFSNTLTCLVLEGRDRRFLQT